MIVCILTKIPVFIAGATGSSKTLAIKLVGQNLRGSDSNDGYFRKLPQAYLIPYQGSSFSTSDGIIKVFEKANKYQETSSKEFSVISVVVLDEGSSFSTSDGIIKVFEKANKYQETSSKEFSAISVVVLDNVGLAETSQHNPLKLLHTLLEPNYPS
ncbi:e3 ubiquitin-protein ligase [Gigaspora margarita]|uniref:E3 ubiquitin-protein ligase n=1 Tax=Gigaspora margarita TaxID=4874 RepID=A0A8H4ELE6_GIGMA|nr:e3 ubiquitin-protein ligase [Gigaspora margarita]